MLIYGVVGTLEAASIDKSMCNEMFGHMWPEQTATQDFTFMITVAQMIMSGPTKVTLS